MGKKNSRMTWIITMIICNLVCMVGFQVLKIALYVILCILLIVCNYQLDEKIDKYSLIIGICMVVRSYMQKKESTLVGL